MTILGALSVCLCILLSLFLLFIRGPLENANRWLAGFLLLTAVDLAGWMAALVPPDWHALFIVRLPLAYLQMPMLYAYAGHLCFPAWRSRWNWIGGILPAGLSALLLVPRAKTMAGFGASPTTLFDLAAHEIGLHLQFYGYVALMAALLLRYRRVQRAFGERESSLVVPWVATLLGVSLAAHSFVLVKSWAWMDGRPQIYAALDAMVGLIAVGISSALILLAMFKQSLFVGLTTPPAMDRPRAVPAVTDPEAIATLHRYMVEQQPFLDPELTIRTLARRVGMGQRDLSELLNKQLGLHFFDYVNGFRVDRAAGLLALESNRSATVLDIAHRAGFNTKSSFNAAFSKHRGETPTRHRERMLGARAGPG